jgi:hypothetical protein
MKKTASASYFDTGARGWLYFVAFRHRQAEALVEELQSRRVVASLRPLKAILA